MPALPAPRRLVLLALLLAPLAAAAPLVAVSAAAAAGVTVFAAASLGEAMREVADRFEARAGIPVAVSAAASSALARQIEHGAPAGVFVSASADWMDHLEAEGLIAPGTRVDVASNALVLIGPAGAAPVALTAEALTARLGSGRLAMALVDAVPAGIYGRAALRALGAWDAVAPHVAQTDNVRAALALVALGEAPLGVVYATDAAAEPRVAVLATFPEGSHPSIVYPAARTAGAADRAAADAFLAFLAGPEGRAALAAAGFAPPPAAP